MQESIQHFLKADTFLFLDQLALENIQSNGTCNSKHGVSSIVVAVKILDWMIVYSGMFTNDKMKFFYEWDITE